VSIAEEPLSDLEADQLFADFANAPALILAVSGGPDSTALMVLLARWRRRRRRGPALTAVTIDHGLRPEAKREAAIVKKLAKTLGIAHRTLRWLDSKPSTGLQEQARLARYRLLAKAARATGADHIVTGHTLDDQAETVLIRAARGSGITGLRAMAVRTALPGIAGDIVVARPFLQLPKARLLATLRQRRVAFVEDRSNLDPRFTRVRLRALMRVLATEGLDAQRLATLARRLGRADSAIEMAVDAAQGALGALGSWPDNGALALGRAAFFDLPAEVALRLLGRAIALRGDEGPVELNKLETLMAALATAGRAPGATLRRTLAGAMVTLSDQNVVVERAPERRRQPLSKPARGTRIRGKKRRFTKAR
jgi:tRNA(Ile)-lysidine synthase